MRGNITEGEKASFFEPLLGRDWLFMCEINGFDVVSQSFDHSEALHFACDEDFNRIQESIKDCKKKLEAYKKKTEEAYSDVSARDDEIELVADELKDLKAQWASIDEKKQSLKRKERDDLRAEKKLSMYACVTKVIPEADIARKELRSSN
ncbi:hypothetical protein Bca52824_041670 [Brassica carinata]|uniref:Uncharacterized protein n=1 Tax=Brassica carinata TaxID=52824 RepID=A0A8X7RVN1_BRACI|nr:hypothetical protein Bca52824_041670 [Brassica carinata]